MLKILIIDDDALTRKGIQTLMPWTKHGMEIVGEASNGKAALDFLKTHKADLALVDLDMPVMDGMTFIQQASKLYPDLNYVVLTIHTEFEYIQNVLRAGAIDYIAKTQFDQENFDQILSRINANIQQKSAIHYGVYSPAWQARKVLYPYIYALVTIDSENTEQITQFFNLNNLADNSSIYEVFPGVWVFTDERKHFDFPDIFPNTTLLHISDVNEMTYGQLTKLLRNYKTNQFFYDYQPVKKINFKRAYELREEEYITEDAVFDALKAEWVSLNWVHENELFNKIKFDLKKSKLKFSQLYHILLMLENVWNASYSARSGQMAELPSVFHHWSEVEDWLIDIYEKANTLGLSAKYSSEITQNILAAKQFIDSNYDEQLNITEIARNAHMSYGYFSRCFRDIVGMSVSDYCIQIRITIAKDALSHTSKSLQQIASEIGYSDEKYFSRLFKKVTGHSPSDYRKSKT